jgi:hypothetical protein
MPTNKQVAFSHLKKEVFRAVAAHPRGIRQSDVAKIVGIPKEFDHNWITKGILDGLVTEGRLHKSERKLFTIAA